MQSLPRVIIASCILLLAACSGNPEKTALETYLSEGENIAQEMSDVGTRFETLMNVQANILAWTPEEKTELQAVVGDLDTLLERAKDLKHPSTLNDVHPLLVQALEEMGAAVDGVASVSNDPSKATEEFGKEIERHATDGERLATEYATELEAAVQTQYPDLADDAQ